MSQILNGQFRAERPINIVCLFLSRLIPFEQAAEIAKYAECVNSVIRGKTACYTALISECNTQYESE